MTVGTLMPECVLAALLGGPQPIETAGALLVHFQGWLSDLRRVPVHEIADIPGINQQNVARIKAAVELGLRLTLITEEDRPTIYSAARIEEKYGRQKLSNFPGRSVRFTRCLHLF